MSCVRGVPTRRSRADTYIGRLEIPNRVVWPHTHGEPELYAARLQVRLHGSSETVVADLGRSAFRTVTLHTRNGEFALHINGVPIFCRGACWTPLDRSASMRPGTCCVRRWPSALAGRTCCASRHDVYESDDFLDLCDSNGILLWQISCSPT